MASDDNKAAVKTAGKSQQEPEAILPPSEEQEAPQGDNMIVQPPPSSASASTQEIPTKNVQAVALCPIYYKAGFPPHSPGSGLSICAVTARHWLAAGLIRLEPGENLPVSGSVSSDFLVLPPGGTPAPASQG